VNLIGEHIDYHDLPVLPIAIQRRIYVAFRANPSSEIHVKSEGYEERRASTKLDTISPAAAGDWSNYLLAAVQLVASHWPLTNGINAAIASDLPPAAGLSSSSALLIGLTLALLDANSIQPRFDELMNILPDGEQFVGTRGGGMDHAVILGSQPETATLIEFAPTQITPVNIPDSWTFLAAHSLTTAEKSGAARLAYNSRRQAGTNALRAIDFSSYCSALKRYSVPELTQIAQNAAVNDEERQAFLHVITEAERVQQAVAALEKEDSTAFGSLLCASHASLRDWLRVSNPALDELVDCAMRCGALGARLTGAGFGGYAIILCKKTDQDRVRNSLMRQFYANRARFDPDTHLFFAEPSAGVLADPVPASLICEG